MAKTKGFQFSFERYIVQFRKEKSEKGILARIVFNNCTFPRVANEFTIKQYLKNHGASDDVLKMMDNVWPEFEKIKLQNAKSPLEIGAF